MSRPSRPIELFPSSRASISALIVLSLSTIPRPVYSAPPALPTLFTATAESFFGPGLKARASLADTWSDERSRAASKSVRGRPAGEERERRPTFVRDATAEVLTRRQRAPRVCELRIGSGLSDQLGAG